MLGEYSVSVWVFPSFLRVCVVGIQLLPCAQLKREYCDIPQPSRPTAKKGQTQILHTQTPTQTSVHVCPRTGKSTQGPHWEAELDGRPWRGEESRGLEQPKMTGPRPLPHVTEPTRAKEAADPADRTGGWRRVGSWSLWQSQRNSP